MTSTHDVMESTMSNYLAYISLFVFFPILAFTLLAKFFRCCKGQHCQQVLLQNIQNYLTKTQRSEQYAFLLQIYGINSMLYDVAMCFFAISVFVGVKIAI